jgi:hypothetical protein
VLFRSATLEGSNNYLSLPSSDPKPNISYQSNPNPLIEKFDPSSWTGGGIDVGNTLYETIPHTIVVEWHKNDNKARYLAVRNDSGEELAGCPVPTSKVKSINEGNMTATDDFDQVYTLRIIE